MPLCLSVCLRFSQMHILTYLSLLVSWNMKQELYPSVVLSLITVDLCSWALSCVNVCACLFGCIYLYIYIYIYMVYIFCVYVCVYMLIYEVCMCVMYGI